MSEQPPDVTPLESTDSSAEQPQIQYGFYQGKEVEIKDHIEKGGKEYAILSDGQKVPSQEIEYTGRMPVSKSTEEVHYSSTDSPETSEGVVLSSSEETDEIANEQVVENPDKPHKYKPGEVKKVPLKGGEKSAIISKTGQEVVVVEETVRDEKEYVRLASGREIPKEDIEYPSWSDEFEGKKFIFVRKPGEDEPVFEVEDQGIEFNVQHPDGIKFVYLKGLDEHGSPQIIRARPRELVQQTSLPRGYWRKIGSKTEQHKGVEVKEAKENIPEPKKGDQFIYPNEEDGDIKVEVAAVAADAVGNKIYDLKITMPNGEIQESHPTLSEFKQALADHQGSWRYLPVENATLETSSVTTETEEKEGIQSSFKPGEKVNFHLTDSVVSATFIEEVEKQRGQKKQRLAVVEVEEGSDKGQRYEVPLRFIKHFTQEPKKTEEPEVETHAKWDKPEKPDLAGSVNDEKAAERSNEEETEKITEEAEQAKKLEEQVESFLGQEVAIKSEDGEWIDGYRAFRYVVYEGEELVVIGQKTEEHAVLAEDFLRWQEERSHEEREKKKAEKEKKEKEESMLTVRVELDESIGPEVTIEDLKDPEERRRRVWQKRKERASNSAVGLSAKQFKKGTGALGRRWSGRVMRLKSGTINYFFNSEPSDADKEKLFKEPLDDDELKRRQIALVKKLNEGQLTKQEAEKLQNKKLTDEQWDYISNNQAEKDKLLKDQIRRIEEKEELSDEEWSHIKNGELTDNINSYLQNLDEHPLTSAERASREERKRDEIKKKLRKRQGAALAVGTWAVGASSGTHIPL